MKPSLELVTRRPPGRARPTPLLFVHGAWHGAWCWEQFMPFFAGLGYTCHALSLRGHGASEGRAGIRWHAIADYVVDLETVVAALPAPPVIIAHSLGAFVTQRYLERRRVPAAVLLAPMPVMGVAGWVARYLARHPLVGLRALGSGNLRHLVGTPALAREAFFSPDLPADALARHLARLQPESLRIALDSLRRPRPQPGTPMLVLAAAEDRVFTLAEVTATARAWGAELEVLPGLAHDVMLDTGWERAAARVAHWLLRTVDPEPDQFSPACMEAPR